MSSTPPSPANTPIRSVSAWLDHHTPWWAAGSLLLVGAFISIVNFWYTYDDAWVTYRVAYNFATGVGFVFNAGEHVLVTTAPLYGLTLGVLGWLFGPDRIPMFSGAISGLSFTLAGIALYDLGRTGRRPLAGWLAGYFFLTNPIFFDLFGGEMPFMMALGLWAFAAYARDCRRTSAVLLALATLARPDEILAAIVLFGYDAIRARRVPLREVGWFALVLLPFAVGAWIYYGTPLPSTLSAKLAQGDSLLWPTFGKGLRFWLVKYLMAGVRGPRFDVFSFDPGTFSFWLTLGVPALLWFRAWWLPLAWLCAFVFAYRTLQIPFYHWYAAPAVVILAMLAGSGLAGATALARRLLPRVPAPWLTAIGVALAIYATAPWVRTAAAGPVVGPHLAQYEEVGRWLAANTAPDSTVAFYEIGVIGYYAKRSMIDPLGLLDPTVPPHVARREFAFAYERDRPTYILELEGASLYHAFKERPWFAQEYRQVHTFTGPGSGQHALTLWRRVTADRAPAAP